MFLDALQLLQCNLPSGAGVSNKKPAVAGATSLWLPVAFDLVLWLALCGELVTLELFVPECDAQLQHQLQRQLLPLPLVRQQPSRGSIGPQTYVAVLQHARLRHVWAEALCVAVREVGGLHGLMMLMLLVYCAAAVMLKLTCHCCQLQCAKHAFAVAFAPASLGLHCSTQAASHAVSDVQAE